MPGDGDARLTGGPMVYRVAIKPSRENRTAFAVRHAPGHANNLVGLRNFKEAG